jgi:hypothetical protein
LRNLYDAALAYLRDVEPAGAEVPRGAARDVTDELLVTVTI